MSPAYLLVSHGSRDPRPQIAVDRLAQQVSIYLRQSSSTDLPVIVATAQLELADKPLHSQIQDFAHDWMAQGIDRIVLLPLFLLPGVHVMDDIPAEVVLAQQANELLELTVAPFLGSAPNILDLFAKNRSDLPEATTILAHGSRRLGGNTTVERLATSLNVELAYWSIEPSLTERVTAFIDRGATEIGILPYFLFTGGITDAIAELVAKLNQQFPQIKLTLQKPIGNSERLVKTLGEILAAIDN